MASGLAVPPHSSTQISESDQDGATLAVSCEADEPTAAENISGCRLSDHALSLLDAGQGFRHGLIVGGHIIQQPAYAGIYCSGPYIPHRFTVVLTLTQKKRERLAEAIDMGHHHGQMSGQTHRHQVRIFFVTH